MNPFKKLQKYCQTIWKLKKFYAKKNTVIIIEPDGTEIYNPKFVKNLSIRRIPKGGVNLKLHQPLAFKKLVLDICGNTEIEIGENYIEPVGNIKIIKSIGTSINKVVIGTASGIGDAVFDITLHGNIIIGKACTMSWGITLKTDDTHPIYQNGKLINRSRDIVIGDNCWIGMNATILKNSILANGTIIGANALVAGKFFQENTIIAGNPARVVKENINWKCGLINYETFEDEPVCFTSQDI